VTTRTSCDLGVTQHVIKPTYDDLWIAKCPKYGNLGTYPNYFDAVGAVVAHTGLPAAAEGESDE
jgi:hypothetical protein